MTIADKLAAALLDTWMQLDVAQHSAKLTNHSRIVAAARAAMEEYETTKAAPRSVWRLTHYGDEVGLFTTLESAKAAVQPASVRVGFPATVAEWRRDGMGTWHSVGPKGWEIDECEVLA